MFRKIDIQIKFFFIHFHFDLVVVNGQRNECEKKRMDYFRCEKKIESDDSLPTLCDKVSITILDVDKDT